jgi:hypothetical protein
MSVYMPVLANTVVTLNIIKANIAHDQFWFFGPVPSVGCENLKTNTIVIFVSKILHTGFH